MHISKTLPHKTVSHLDSIADTLKSNILVFIQFNKTDEIHITNVSVFFCHVPESAYHTNVCMYLFLHLLC